MSFKSKIIADSQFYTDGQLRKYPFQCTYSGICFYLILMDTR